MDIPGTIALVKLLISSSLSPGSGKSCLAYSTEDMAPIPIKSIASPCLCSM